MLSINYPDPSFRVKSEDGRDLIFDPFRKKWVVLTPEEWVRQNFLQYLIQVMAYPATLVAVEKELKLGELKKRFDILVYDPAHRPWLMVECKSGDIPLDEKVLEQALRYNISIPVPYLIICNGLLAMGWKKEAGGLELLRELPAHPAAVPGQGAAE